MLKLASVFKDHMVVQRERAIAVFGTGEPGEKVFVPLFTSKSHTTVKKDGTYSNSTNYSKYPQERNHPLQSEIQTVSRAFLTA